MNLEMLLELVKKKCRGRFPVRCKFKYFRDCLVSVPYFFIYVQSLILPEKQYQIWRLSIILYMLAPPNYSGSVLLHELIIFHLIVICLPPKTWKVHLYSMGLFKHHKVFPFIEHSFFLKYRSVSVNLFHKCVYYLNLTTNTGSIYIVQEKKRVWLHTYVNDDPKWRSKPKIVTVSTLVTSNCRYQKTSH